MRMEKISSVYQSTEYGKFKKLLGNREIADGRVNRIRESIEANGWITNPIVVNEKFEIIDGQGRWAALRQLGMPVQFVIHDGATIDDCIALNLKQKNWTMTDYARSYAEQGKPDYIRLCDISERLNLSIPLAASFICERIMDGSHYTATLTNGTFTAPQERYNAIKNNAEFIHLCLDNIKKRHGLMTRIAGPCFLFCYTNQYANKDRIWEIAENKMDLIPPLNTSIGVLDAISQVYNKGLRASKHLAFDALYKMRLLELNK